MSKDKPQKAPEPATEKPATLCVGLSAKDGKYLIEEIHLGADGKVLSRNPMRPALTSRKLAAGHAIGDFEAAVVRWQAEGLLP